MFSENDLKRDRYKLYSTQIKSQANDIFNHYLSPLSFSKANSNYDNRKQLDTLLFLLKQCTSNSILTDCPAEVITVSNEQEPEVCKELLLLIFSRILSLKDSREELFKDFVSNEGANIKYIYALLNTLKDRAEELDCQLIQVTMKLLNFLPVTQDLLKATFIGKMVTPLKAHPNATVKNQAAVLERKWRTLAENYINSKKNPPEEPKNIKIAVTMKTEEKKHSLINPLKPKDTPLPATHSAKHDKKDKKDKTPVPEAEVITSFKNNHPNKATNSNLKLIKMGVSEDDVQDPTHFVSKQNQQMSPIDDNISDDPDVVITAKEPAPNRVKKKVSWANALVQESFFLKDEAPVHINMPIEQVEKVQTRIIEEMQVLSKQQSGSNAPLSLPNNTMTNFQALQKPNPYNTPNSTNPNQQFINFQSKVFQTISSINNYEKQLFKNSKDYKSNLSDEEKRDQDLLAPKTRFRLVQTEWSNPELQRIQDNLGECSVVRQHEDERTRLLPRIIYENLNLIPKDPKEHQVKDTHSSGSVQNIPLKERRVKMQAPCRRAEEVDLEQYQKTLVASNPGKTTFPCRHFHSVQGCKLGDACKFIHDKAYAHKPHPLLKNYTVIKKDDTLPTLNLNNNSVPTNNIPTNPRDRITNGITHIHSLVNTGLHSPSDVQFTGSTVNLNSISNWMDSKLNNMVQKPPVEGTSNQNHLQEILNSNSKGMKPSTDQSGSLGHPKDLKINQEANGHPHDAIQNSTQIKQLFEVSNNLNNNLNADTNNFNNINNIHRPHSRKFKFY